VVFIAGGVGVNPVMSMVSTMHELGFREGEVGGMVRKVRVLYGTKTENGERILFYDRLKRIAEHWKENRDVDFQFILFETGTSSSSLSGAHQPEVKHNSRRMVHADLFEALGPEDDRANTVVYVCGPPSMTDEFVQLLQNAPGMEDRRVLCEKWW
jgi:ferredoxin-NADP reductase